MGRRPGSKNKKTIAKQDSTAKINNDVPMENQEP